jgi:hypothetical protein
MIQPDDNDDEADALRIVESGWQKSVAPPTDESRPGGPPRAADSATRPAAALEQSSRPDAPKEKANDG